MKIPDMINILTEQKNGLTGIPSAQDQIDKVISELYRLEKTNTDGLCDNCQHKKTCKLYDDLCNSDTSPIYDIFSDTMSDEMFTETYIRVIVCDCQSHKSE